MNNILEKKQHYNILYGYYGMLLTDKQKEIFEYYFYQDYSLAEIANELEISRNAIYDALKTVQTNLDEFEEKMHLYVKDQKVEALLNQYEPLVSDKGKELIKKIKEME